MRSAWRASHTVFLPVSQLSAGTQSTDVVPKLKRGAKVSSNDWLHVQSVTFLAAMITKNNSSLGIFTCLKSVLPSKNSKYIRWAKSNLVMTHDATLSSLYLNDTWQWHILTTFSRFSGDNPTHSGLTLLQNTARNPSHKFVCTRIVLANLRLTDPPG